MMAGKLLGMWVRGAGLAVDCVNQKWLSRKRQLQPYEHVFVLALGVFLCWKLGLQWLRVQGQGGDGSEPARDRTRYFAPNLDNDIGHGTVSATTGSGSRGRVTWQGEGSMTHRYKQAKSVTTYHLGRSCSRC